MEPPPKEPELVRSGLFHIDRERAVELLSKYALKDPALYVLPLIRCAVASGATDIRVAVSGRSVAVTFDGRSFSEAEVRAIFDHLVDPSAEARLRELARGVVSVLSGGAQARVACDGPEGRKSLVLSRGSEEDAPGAPLNSIAVTWPGDPPSLARARLFERCVLCRARIRVTPGVELPKAAETLSEGRPGAPSRIALHVLGVLSTAVEEWIDGPQVDAHWADDQLSLDLGREGIRRDERWVAALKALAAKAQALAQKRCRELSLTMPRDGDVLRDPILYAKWKEAFAPGSDPDGLDGAFLWIQRRMALDAGVSKSREAELLERARVVAWLRDAALRTFAGGREPEAPWEKELWSAPIYLTSDGIPISVHEIERVRARFGRVMFSQRKHSGDEWRVPTQAVTDRAEMLRIVAGSAGDALAEP